VFKNKDRKKCQKEIHQNINSNLWLAEDELYKGFVDLSTPTTVLFYIQIPYKLFSVVFIMKKSIRKVVSHLSLLILT
jgi:hypothetical protein